jgi:cephalosporin-C deacetylase-like acetyl esterase
MAKLVALIVVGLILAAASALGAEAKAQLSVRTDAPGAVYKKGDTVTFLIELAQGGQPVADASLKVELSTDAFRRAETQTVHVAAGRAEVKASRAEPCVLWIRATYEPEGGEKVETVTGAAFAPDEIGPSMPLPADFDQFWAAQKARVDAVPANPVLEPMPCDVRGCELYKVTMDNVDGTKVHCYLAKPVGAGPFPGLLRFQWSGVYSLEPNWALNYARLGFLALNVNPHDVEDGRPPEYYWELNSGALKDYAHQGRDSRDTSYLLGMFLRCYRGAQYLASRPDWDGRHLLATGGSMGGGQALATAALSPHVTALFVDAPAMCDHTAAVVGRTPGWPWLVAVSGGEPNRTQLEMARYFDGVNFARRIKVPAIVGTAFADLTCPSSTVIAACNALQGPRRLVLDPLCGHNGPKPNWEKESQAFMRKHGGL